MHQCIEFNIEMNCFCGTQFNEIYSNLIPQCVSKVTFRDFCSLTIVTTEFINRSTGIRMIVLCLYCYLIVLLLRMTKTGIVPLN